MPDRSNGEWLTTKQVADELQVSENTVVDWRYRNTGPRFARLGSRLVRYRRSDLDRWLETSAR